MPPASQQAYEELLRLLREHAVLSSCGSLLNWDEQTHMPRNGSTHRADQMALLARMSHELLTAPRLGELLEKVESSPLVADRESIPAANVREFRRIRDRAMKLPRDLVEEIARVTTQAGQIWRDARKADSFEQFRPALEKVIALKRQEAQAVGYKESIYDAVLDEYEPGATTSEITRLFAELRKDLVPLVAAIAASSRRPNREIIHREYPVERQQVFGQAAAAAIGFDFDAGRLDRAVHPFCSGIGPGDCRLTTRYNPRHFNEGFFGILHEAGHGIYEQGLEPRQFGTACGSPASLGLHESQSRLWENQVGRSRLFWQHWFPRAQQVFLDALRDVDLNSFHFAINDVQPSFIRVEADEVTYNMHIILRFELEQALLSGDLRPADLPGAWNEKFQQMFRMTPATDNQGCLQDIHWSMGGLGYFPTYTLGNLYAAQFMEQARSDLPSLEDDFRRGEYALLKHWLNEKLHRQGQRFRANDLCRRVTGKPLSHRPLMSYLRERFGALYGI